MTLAINTLPIEKIQAFMACARRMAKQSDKISGAVVVYERAIGWEIIGKGATAVEVSNNPLAEADIIAIQQAARQLGTADLDGAILFSTSLPSNAAYASCWTSNIHTIIVDQDPVTKRDFADFSLPVEARSVSAQRFDPTQVAEARNIIFEWARRWPDDPLLSAMDTNNKALPTSTLSLAPPAIDSRLAKPLGSLPEIPVHLHRQFIEKAIGLSKAALERKSNGLPVGAPFGAVVVRMNTSGDWEVAGEGFNHVNEKLDVTSHGEIEAIRHFCESHDRELLKQSVIYTSCEPCAICYSVIKETGIRRMYYGNGLQDTAQLFDLSGQYQWMSLPDARRCESFHEICKKGTN